MAASRWCYNKTIEYLNTLVGPRPHWTVIKKQIVHSVPEWFRDVPFQVKSIAIKDACKAVSANKKKAKLTGQPFKMRFRSRKKPKQSCFIPMSAIKSCGSNVAIYLRIAGIFRAGEPLPQQHRDSRLVWEHGAWFLSVTFIDTVKQADNQGKAVSIDPGVRTFVTFFSPDSYGKIGHQAQSRIIRLLLCLDRLKSKHAKSDNRRRRRLRLAIGRLTRKIGNLIDELHWKSIRFLLDNFDVIVIPPFSAKQCSSKINRRLHNKSVRAMLGLAHYRFRMRLTAKAEQEGKDVKVQCEAYTSKTCSWSGEVVHNLGGRRRIKGKDNVSVDRDVNAARGILLRALGDTPTASAVHAANASYVRVC